MRFLFPLAILLGSFLLFIVQPMLAKALLPHVGGAPAVWVASMLFFQLLLLVGYGYATLSSSYMSAQRQSQLHIGLMITAVLVSLPLSLHVWHSVENTAPEQWVLSTLVITIGLPYLLLSANATLLQRWYYEVKQTSPYFLFGISNIGSLLGLLSYPLLIEWLLPLQEQMFYWSLLFYGLIALLTLTTYRLGKPEPQLKKSDLGKQLPLSQILRIVFYGFIPSSLFLSTTLFITTDIAPIPLLWVTPLALYLLSFTIVFSRNSRGWIRTAQHLHIPACALVFLLASYVFAFVSHFYANHYYMLQIGICLLCLFVVALNCHGRVAQQKPAPQYLASYYFWLAVGGALGGLFTTTAPYIFNDIYEYPFILLLSLSVPLAHEFATRASMSNLRKFMLIGGCTTIAASILITWTENKDYPAQYKARNFFGVKEVIDLGYPFFRRDLQIGSTLQGHQPTFPGHELYVNNNLKQLIARAPKNFFDKPFGVIGLGTGMLACTAAPNQVIDFFEIDPLVVKIAEDPDLFTYLRDCAGKPNITLGDGRHKIAERPSNHYKLIVLDAFNSNVIPVHLLTAEAIGTYLDKLDKNQGFLAFNIISRHTDLSGILARVAQEHEVLAYHKRFEYDPEFPYDGAGEWMFLVRKDSPWLPVFEALEYEQITDTETSPLWTDDYSSIVPILK
ncbi:MAG: fused MFS/spermidine synthase [Rickettsiales bacterium]|nr:fused MFS/spermidine synthase [Rickettsiales bacterium]